VFLVSAEFRRCVILEWTNSCSARAFCIRSWMAEFILPLKYGFTIFSVNSVSKGAGTLWNVKFTRNPFSIVVLAVLFFLFTNYF
jgi:hypothetical protein